MQVVVIIQKVIDIQADGYGGQMILMNRNPVTGLEVRQEVRGELYSGIGRGRILQQWVGLCRW